MGTGQLSSHGSFTAGHGKDWFRDNFRYQADRCSGCQGVWKTAHGTRVHWSPTFTGTMIDNNESVISAFTKCSAEIHQRQTSVESSWTSRFGLSFCRNLQSLKLACVFSQVNHASKIWWHSVCENAARERNKPREALLESWVLPGFAWNSQESHVLSRRDETKVARHEMP